MFLKVGWMYRYGSSSPISWWALWWFELDQLTCTLKYFKSPKKNTFKGYITLDGTQNILGSEKFNWTYLPKWLNRKNVFGIVTAKESITLCCYYDGEKESWIEIIGMFGPEMFNKRSTSAKYMNKCMVLFEARNAKRREEKKAAQEKTLLETHLPIHTKLYGLKDTLSRHHIPSNYTYPYAQVPRFSFNNPRINEHIRSIANRAMTLLAHIPPATASSLSSRRTSLQSDRVRVEEVIAKEDQINDLLDTLTETQKILGSLENKQQEQDGHIRLLDSVFSAKSH